ncbi:CHAP domain-containing protein, partial [Staphylococcus pseudintermedius]|uniref:CHAP domain-containing protein n=1 Tax=Staphylococcus pseudintermedius TaxID=283734 RepID=UPI000E39253B
SSYSSRDYASSYTTTTTSTRSVSRGGSSANLYTASNWASAAAAAGYTVNNRPSAGAILQKNQGAFCHVTYVETDGSDGSISVSEMNYGYGPGVGTSRTISASKAASYNDIQKH